MIRVEAENKQDIIPAAISAKEQLNHKYRSSFFCAGIS